MAHAFGLGVCFDLGRYHATPWGTHVNDGQVEWPPSPWRILRALFSASRTDLRVAGRADAVDSALKRLLAATPPRYGLPPSAAAHTRHYVPSQKWSQTASGETDLILDAFRALQSDAELTVWWAVQLPVDERMALERAAAAVAYLGRSESLCTVRLLDGTDPGDRPLSAPLQQATGDGRVVDVLCPDAGASLDQLTVSVETLRSQRRVQPPGARWVSYRLNEEVPPAPPPPTQTRPTLAILRLTGAGRPNVREAVALAETVRRRVQGVFGSHTAGETSESLSGHRNGEARKDQHRHAHYLSLPEPGGRRVDRVAIWVPEGLDSTAVAALAELRQLKLRNAPDPLRITLVALGTANTMTEPALLGPSTSWRTVTPFALPRHPKQRGGRAVELPEEQLRRELTHRGLPEPAEVELLRGDWASFKRTRSGGSRTRAPLAVGASLRFAEPLRGPLALGALSHFGLGLFLAEGQ